MGPQLTVLIIEVSLFQSVHNSRFDCITILTLLPVSLTDDDTLVYTAGTPLVLAIISTVDTLPVTNNDCSNGTIVYGSY